METPDGLNLMEWQTNSQKVPAPDLPVRSLHVLPVPAQVFLSVRVRVHARVRVL